MTSLLPVVEETTATAALRDLIQEEMQSPETDGLLMGWFGQIGKENPSILMAVSVLMGGSTEREKSAAFMGMAITYRALSAQAEVEALKRMAL